MNCPLCKLVFENDTKTKFHYSDEKIIKGDSCMLYVDSREPWDNVKKWFEKQGFDIELKRTTLEIGDYLISTPNIEISIERKEVGDYINSLQTGRLNNQLFQLSTNYEISFLMIHGSLTNALFERNVNRDSIISSIVGSCFKISSSGRCGVIQTLFFETPYDVAAAIYYLHEKAEKGDYFRLPKPFGNKIDSKTCMATLLCCIPGVGEERAKLLAEKFPTLKSLVNAKIIDFMEVEGIGKITAQKIYNFIHGEQ